MSSVNKLGQNRSNENVAARSTNYDNVKPASDKRKTAAITRRMSFSTTRPWSSYAENYSSCLSGLRRNSSSVQSQRKGSLQSSQRSSFSDLSRSFDGEQFKNLKTSTASDNDSKQRTLKASALYARPFHQRRWSSPVAFPVANISKHLPQHVKDEAVSTDEAFQDSTDKKKDKIPESEEITLSHVQHKPSVSALQNTVNEESDKSPDILSSSMNSTMEISPTKCGDNETGQEENKKTVLWQNNESASSTVTDATGKIISTVTDAPKTEEPVQKRNIYTEIKKNTKWSCSKSFKRRHHTIHADSHRFLNHNLFTIIEQSSGSFSATNNAQNSNERNSGWKLQSIQRSKSLNDLTTLSKQGKNNAVFVQRLASRSLCVSVAGSSEKQKCPAAVQYPTRRDVGNNAIDSMQHPVQVNVQTFNYAQRSNYTKPEFRAVMCGEQPKTIPRSKNQAIVSTQQHAIFTQAKTKLASITISQV